MNNNRKTLTKRRIDKKEGKNISSKIGKSWYERSDTNKEK